MRLSASVAFLVGATWASVAPAQSVWTRPAPIYGLTGGVDVLAAATAGGVVLWDLPSGRTRHLTTAEGLPSHLALAACFAPDAEVLGVATANGMARGSMEGPWHSVLARTDERGPSLSACLALPAGRLFAGGDRAQLLLWEGERLDSLLVPTRAGRVVALALFTSWLGAVRHTDPQRLDKAGAPPFPLGLAAGVDNDGVWLLRRTSESERWLRFVQEDGLPSHRVRQLLADSRGRLWVATDRGLAWIGSDLGVHAFPASPLLAQRCHALVEGEEGFLYVGLDAGLARLHLDRLEEDATLVAGIAGPVVALARTRGEIWWSAGSQVSSLTGQELLLPAGPAANFTLALLARSEASGARAWFGHPFGMASCFLDPDWAHFGAEQGLPPADITSFLFLGDTLFVGTATAGLFVRRDALSMPHLPRIPYASVRKAAAGSPHFVPVAGAPTHIATQAFARGLQWVGGDAGLHARRGGAWEELPLWPGAHTVVDLIGAGDTLWASASYAGLAFHAGQTWLQPPCSSALLGAYFGSLSRDGRGHIAVATDRGLALWDGALLQPAPGSPDAFLLDVQWWGTEVACGTHRGLWILGADGTWSLRGVLEGLPGAQVRALDQDAAGHLWVATTRGLGRLPPGDTPSPPHAGQGPHPGGLQPPLAPQGMPGGFDTRGGNAVRSEVTPAAIAVYDVRGRFVCRLEPNTEPIPHWDGRDAHGRTTGRGVYFLRPLHDQERSRKALRP